MSLFAIADLHLSLGKDKPMCIFKGWENHTERLLANWNSRVTADDTVVIAGDISWAASLEDSLPDLDFIDRELHGKKIILKGNHDFWWATLSKVNSFLTDNKLQNISFLHNNAFLIGEIAVAGTRGWVHESDESHCEKIQKREPARLERSIESAKALTRRFEVSDEHSKALNPSNTGEICVFLHYPPAYGDFANYHLIDVLQKHRIKRCYYGHLHGSAHTKALLGEHYGVEFALISADYVGFTPVKIN
ncbi:MAG: metallophosphoesterase [Oscillospiraceae bacterium]|nr:metallophosphoesterase [Oscillospiraceae bacterium]